MYQKQLTMIQSLTESQSVQSLNFDKVHKTDNQREMGPPMKEKMADIICSNFASRISQTTSEAI